MKIMAEQLEVGDKVPEIVAPCVWGREFILSKEVAEHPVLLYFYPANYGLMCTYYSEQMNEFYEEFETIGVTVFHVNPESTENHRAWMGRVASVYNHISDADQNISRMFGMIVGPSYVKEPLTNRGFALIDKEMTLRYVWRAEIPANIVELNELCETLRGILCDDRNP